MKFRFRLEKLLHLKKLEAQGIKKNLAEALLEEKKNADFLDHLQSDRSKSFGFRNQVISDKSQSSELANYTEDFIRGQDIRIERQKKAVQVYKQKVENIRNLLIEKDKELKILERLKEIKHEEYVKYQSAEEIKELDDMTSSRFLNKSGDEIE